MGWGGEGGIPPFLLRKGNSDSGIYSFGTSFFFHVIISVLLFLNFLLCTRILGLLFSEIICSFTTNENDFMDNKK